MKRIMSFMLVIAVLMSSFVMGASASAADRVISISAGDGSVITVAYGESFDISVSLDDTYAVMGFDLSWDVPTGFTMSGASCDVSDMDSEANVEEINSGLTSTGKMTADSGDAVETSSLATLGFIAPNAKGTYTIGINVDDIYDGDYDSYTISNSSVSVTVEVVNNCVHEWGEGVNLEGDEPDCENPGTKTFTCDLCGDTMTEDDPALGHEYDNGVVTTPATCVKNGTMTFTCARCDKTYTEDIAPTGEHAWDEGEILTDSDNANCTRGAKVTYCCTNEGCTKSEVREEGSALGHNYVDDICTRCGQPKPACEHPDVTDADYAYASEADKPTCAVPGKMTAVCPNPECGLTLTKEIPATGEHEYDDNGWVETKPATCADGEEVRYCTVCEGEDTKETRIIPATGEHIWGEWTETKPATCAEGEETRICSVCETPETRKTAPVEEHTWGEWTVTTPATCKPGERSHECSVCETVATEVIPAIDHNYDDDGVCIWCGDCKHLEQFVSVSYSALGNGTHNVIVTCTKCNNVTDTEAKDCENQFVTEEYVAPDCTEQGKEVYECIYCHAKTTVILDELGHAYVGNTCDRCGHRKPSVIIPDFGSTDDEDDGDDEEETPVDPVDPVDPDPIPVQIFSDIPVGSEYYDAVNWAYMNKITTGMTADTFGPEFTCTRAQIVTFIWRAAGCPEPTSNVNNFTDVEKGAYYEKALLWAIEMGITNGTSATTFSPDVIITHEQFVTFLYRFIGQPQVDSSIVIKDAVADEYYNNALRWAIQTEIAFLDENGNFGVGKPCSRGESVTYLYLCFAD